LPNLFRTIVECDRQQLKARRFEEFSPTSLVEFRHKSTNVSGGHVVTIARLRFQDSSLRQPVEQ